MDTLSVAANIVGFSDFCDKLIRDIGGFEGTGDIPESPASAATLYGTAKSLRDALHDVRSAGVLTGTGINVLDQHVIEMPLEKDHRDSVADIVRSSCALFHLLRQQLPAELSTTSETADGQVRAGPVIAVHSPAVQSTAHQMKCYTHMLQLSLATSSAISTWRSQTRSPEQVHRNIRQLTDGIRSANLPTDDRGPNAPTMTPSIPGTPNSSAGAPATASESTTEIDFRRRIRTWLKMTMDMAETLALYTPSQTRFMTANSADRDWKAEAKKAGRDFLANENIDIDGIGNNGNDVDDFDPEPDWPDFPSRDILQLHLEQNQKMVAKLERCGIFLRAAAYQRKAINYRSQLARAYNIPFPRTERADMHEHLADVLASSNTRQGSSEARELLEALLHDEVHRSPHSHHSQDSQDSNHNHVDPQRRSRLYHRLGKLYLEQHNARQARIFLSRAFEARKNIVPMPRQLVAESADLLIRALQTEQAFDEADGYIEWKRQNLIDNSRAPIRMCTLQETAKDATTFPEVVVTSVYSDPGPPPLNSLPDLPTTTTSMTTMTTATTENNNNNNNNNSNNNKNVGSPSPLAMGGISPTPPTLPLDPGLASALAWCRERHFNVNSPSFRFEVFDSNLNTSPLHLAILEENLDAFRHMLGLVADLEHRDATMSTPLLVAATTRNRETTRLLLERAAIVDVRDVSSLSPLHRCQSRSGGVQVARLLLQYLPPPPSPSLAPSAGVRPHMMNAADSSGRTALYMAIDNGNEKMARFLLDEGANPNLPDLLGKTPLFMACERGDDRMARCILDYGADPDIRGPGLCTPLIATIEAAIPAVTKCTLVKLLLDHAADPRITNSDGHNAFAAARTSSFSSEIRWLLQQQNPQPRRPRMTPTDTVATAATDAASATLFGSHASRSSFASHRSRRP